jgi:hypothetical protein
MSLSEQDLEALWRTNRPLAEALYKRLKGKREMTEDAPYVKALFGPQYRFFADPAKRKAALCSRRAGKTEAIAAWLLDGAKDSPGGLSLYVALSRNNCRLILWATMEAIEARHKIGLRFKEQDNQLMIITPNGHRIWLAGCKDSAEIEKFRGMKFRRAAIDEGASYGPYLRELVDDVLGPALLDLNGELAIIGTPGAIPVGFFFEVTTGEGVGHDASAQWSTHSWTCDQNPYIQLNDVDECDREAEIKAAEDRDYCNPRVEAFLEAEKTRHNWMDDHPTYLREWRGVWIRDEGALVYPYNPELNQFRRLPSDDDEVWSYAIGCDVGYEDDTAFVVAGFRRYHPEIYIVYAEKRKHMIPSAVAARLEMLQRKWKASTIIMDTGGMGKGYAEECHQRYGIYCMPAEKTKKRAYQEIIRGEILAGNIKFQPENCAPLLEELARLVWNEDHTEADSRFPDHLADSFTYVVRSLLPSYRPRHDHGPTTAAQAAQAINNEHRARVQSRLQKNHNTKAAKRRALNAFMRGF